MLNSYIYHSEKKNQDKNMKKIKPCTFTLQQQVPGSYVVTSQPQPPPDSLPPATEETPYDPTEDQDLGDPQQTENKY